MPRRDKAGLGRPENRPEASLGRPETGVGRPDVGLVRPEASVARPDATSLVARLTEGSQTLNRENPFRDAILGLGRPLPFIQLNVFLVCR